MRTDEEYIDGLEILWQKMRNDLSRKERIGRAAFLIVGSGTFALIMFWIGLFLACASGGSTYSPDASYGSFSLLFFTFPFILVCISVLISVWLLLAPSKKI